MRRVLGTMTSNMRFLSDVTVGQARSLHSPASLATRPQLQLPRPRAACRDLHAQSTATLLRGIHAAAASARQVQTHAFTAQYGSDQATNAAYDVRSMPWDPMAANAVSLIGNTGKNVEIKRLETGNIVGNVTLACNHKAGETTW